VHRNSNAVYRWKDGQSLRGFFCDVVSRTSCIRYRSIDQEEWCHDSDSRHVHDIEPRFCTAGFCHMLHFKHWSSIISTVLYFEALRYKPERRGFDSRWCHWNVSLTYSFRSHYGAGVDWASNRNECQEYFLGCKGVKRPWPTQLIARCGKAAGTCKVTIRFHVPKLKNRWSCTSPFLYIAF
jgi:hypothetical protein